MEVTGYLAALMIGISLGLIGGGGSILTVPVLVFLFRVDTVTATAYSLFIVGFTSLVGAIPKYLQREVDLKTAFIFGAPAIVSVYITRAFVVPAIPEEVLSIGSFMITKSVLMMMLFAILMVAASLSMIRRGKPNNEFPEESRSFNYPLILLEGTVVGALTGFVGAGGGFLIIPALVVLSKLPMKKAIGTSLVIIAAKSLIGFAGDLQHQAMNWTLLLSITGLAVTGIFAGNRMSKKIKAETLKKGFGYFVLVMGVYIILHELGAF